MREMVRLKDGRYYISPFGCDTLYPELYVYENHEGDGIYEVIEKEKFFNKRKNLVVHIIKKARKIEKGEIPKIHIIGPFKERYYGEGEIYARGKIIKSGDLILRVINPEVIKEDEYIEFEIIKEHRHAMCLVKAKEHVCRYSYYFSYEEEGFYVYCEKCLRKEKAQKVKYEKIDDKKHYIIFKLAGLTGREVRFEEEHKEHEVEYKYIDEKKHLKIAKCKCGHIEEFEQKHSRTFGETTYEKLDDEKHLVKSICSKCFHKFEYTEEHQAVGNKKMINEQIIRYCDCGHKFILEDLRKEAQEIIEKLRENGWFLDKEYIEEVEELSDGKVKKKYYTHYLYRNKEGEEVEIVTWTSTYRRYRRIETTLMGEEKWEDTSIVEEEKPVLEAVVKRVPDSVMKLFSRLVSIVRDTENTSYLSL